MLRCLVEFGYDIEWRVINAADYGFAQRRRRVFIFAYHQSTNYYQSLDNTTPLDVVLNQGIFAKQFPILHDFNELINGVNLLDRIYKDLVYLSESFEYTFKKYWIY